MARFPETLFMRGCKGLADLPPPILPEIAFAGRSNVGKSSLINGIVQQKDLARASATPGRTRELNFFQVAESLYLVDLPGYGYAKAPKSEIAGWTKLTRDYLRGRTSLRRVFLLIDARHGIKENDREIMRLFDECAVNYQIILTKADKLKAAEVTEIYTQTSEIIKKFGAAYPEVILSSAEKGDGLDHCRTVILQLAKG
jgi:GTP-binding protein